MKNKILLGGKLMRRVLTLLVVLGLGFTLSACTEEQGNYEPGTYFGYTEGNQNTFAVLYVGENGFIESILIDAVYLKTVEDGPVTWEDRGGDMVNGNATTKRSLDGGCGYDMHFSGTYCEAPEGQFMWHEQVDLIAEAVIEAQELPDFSGDADSIAGVTIGIDGYVAAIEMALEQASK
jgi:hypothetical protein